LSHSCEKIRAHRIGLIYRRTSANGLEYIVSDPEMLIAGRERADGYWYIGDGRSIADGPYRTPQQLLTVASDLLAYERNWRVDVFNLSGTMVLSYSSDQVRR
jgi:hypothetical protein